MSYQQAASETAFYNSSASNMYMYNQRQTRIHRDSQGQSASVAPNNMSSSQYDVANMSFLMSQSAGMGLPDATMASGAIAGIQLPLGASQYFYNPADYTYLATPATHPPQYLAIKQYPDNAYGSYTAVALPYFTQEATYPNYLSNFPIIPYTLNYTTKYYTNRPDQLCTNIPGLEDCCGSYSTSESAPGIPYYRSVPQREQEAQIAVVDRSLFDSTPSPQQFPIRRADQESMKHLQYKTIPINVDLDALLRQDPAIPRAVPAVFTPRENMRTLGQSLWNHTPGNRNVYIRGLHPNTDDDTLADYAARFGKVESSKAIMDTSTSACKGFGFAKYFNIYDSELCIRGFYKLGYEVGFARESFNSRLKAVGNESSTNLYIANLPKSMTESQLGALFMDYAVISIRILRETQSRMSRGVGFARFESRNICEEIIKKFHGQPIGEEGLLLQVRYADTSAQKKLKRVSTERRQFRANEYDVAAYGTSAGIHALSPLQFLQ